jgi:hypothetical protein
MIFLQLQDKYREARNNDISKLSLEILDMVNHLTPHDIPLEKRKDKGARGFNNLQTARLLTPRDYIPEFDKDPHKYVPSFRSRKVP